MWGVVGLTDERFGALVVVCILVLFTLGTLVVKR